MSKKICQIHNIGIYQEKSADKEWNVRIEKNLRVHFDGFEIFEGQTDIKYKITVRNIAELKATTNSVRVPGDTVYFEDGTIQSIHNNIAYKIEDRDIVFWAADDVWFITYMLDILFKKQEMTFVHGAGVSANDTGILLLAFGGIGKTSFVANALKRKEVKLLGDDLIILSKDGKLLPYPRPFCLYKYHRTLFPDYFRDKSYKFIECQENDYFKRAVRKLRRKFNMVGNRIYGYLPVSPVKLFSRDKMQTEPVNINRVYILRRKTGIDNIEISECISLTDAVNFAQNVILHEWDINLKLMLNEKAQKFESMTELLGRQREIIEGCLSSADKVFFVNIPDAFKAEKTSEGLDRIILG